MATHWPLTCRCALRGNRVGTAAKRKRPFDYAQLRKELGRLPRLLFLAHRGELLRQAAHVYRCLIRALNETARVGWFVGDEGELDAELVLASVAKLSRREHLPRLHSQHFDYVVVDEVHHAAADSYRRILDTIDPNFLLGLTATPDRADSADILGLFNDLIAFSAGIPRGIDLGRLVPFHYFGVKDEIDYENIPWKNRRFDPENSRLRRRPKPGCRLSGAHGGSILVRGRWCSVAALHMPFTSANGCTNAGYT